MCLTPTAKWQGSDVKGEFLHRGTPTATANVEILVPAHTLPGDIIKFTTDDGYKEVEVTGPKDPSYTTKNRWSSPGDIIDSDDEDLFDLEAAATMGIFRIWW